ncbi:hypothetical protein AAFF_G00250760 [Aldrovandia affinis]|uniref:Uncharacterized protein n=1 Tax=Aldrovandia affinis TaxID=143900 RepID=A0AAD7RCP7_9TELE|nr:hypothetical protein AAFF_G00250760 [Aldrovandia affinis]
MQPLSRVPSHASSPSLEVHRQPASGATSPGQFQSPLALPGDGALRDGRGFAVLERPGEQQGISGSAVLTRPAVSFRFLGEAGTRCQRDCHLPF